jgi:hypothetical protein
VTGQSIAVDGGITAEFDARSRAGVAPLVAADR